MFFNYDDNSVRYTGRFAEYENSMNATATGSYFEIAFKGDFIRLKFDIKKNEHPMPHLWLQLDGGAKFEVPLDAYLRVETVTGKHILKVLLKSEKEAMNRFSLPLVNKMSFLGFEAEGTETLPVDDRKTIEFVGDSITEGVLIDDFLKLDYNDDQNNRAYQDDVTATYASLTAEALNLRDLHMGYGAVGATRAGLGSVPKAADAYPFCFENAPVNYPSPDYILINHGANDRGSNEETYINEYKNLLNVIREKNPKSKIICLSAFCVVWPEKLEQLINDYNRENGTDIVFINSSGWVPVEPLHPRRDGHRAIAEHLIPILKNIIEE